MNFHAHSAYSYLIAKNIQNHPFVHHSQDTALFSSNSSIVNFELLQWNIGTSSHLLFFSTHSHARSFMSFGTSCQYIFLSLVSFTDFHFWIFSTMLSVVSFNISVTLFLVSIGASHFKSSIDSLSVLVSFSHSMAFSDDTTSVFSLFF
jgi:hypothetical protein